MNYFSKNKKWMAYLILLTFLFTCVMPSNLGSMNSFAEAASTENITFSSTSGISQLSGKSSNGGSIARYLWLNGNNLYLAIDVGTGFTIGSLTIGKESLQHTVTTDFTMTSGTLTVTGTDISNEKATAKPVSGSKSSYWLVVNLGNIYANNLLNIINGAFTVAIKTESGVIFSV
mgnify:CR=1 FL=1